ncbi:GNAT family N-acetyltransferase [Roseiflexus castenholzii]|jgi:lipid II:glycine glycyltransferase (peptidoglycan interpeptide bridge formation enzyme)|uniref:BioF2-like acetyltransferase domain-containing protein n=1 Tax=Roseiflexus castenholzii (strain DSM 13941 / HLO8) TaxID=383372 RepID=A7NHE0_ROSCS|nr:GNAT family N-acetyltransferase [Roseiflexus castenholzii]ABU56887.1 conserved hypothetical protein [Roseiflexus castenholzii DSM 13941]
MWIFHQAWWLDAVAPNSWGEITVEQGGKIQARLPYVIKQKYGLKIITMPPLTPFLGPWIRNAKGKYVNRLSVEKELIGELFERIPQFDLFLQNFHHSVTNWQPLYWKEFQQTTHYTYLIPDLTNLDKVWENLKESARREIRKATYRFNLMVRTDLNIDDFLDLHIRTFRRQGKELPYPVSLVQRLDETCLKYNTRKIFIAEDVQGRRHAGVYIVWDEDSAYYLMGGGDPELRSSGATSLCMWEAIKFASTVTKSFDFEGSMIEPIERFFRSFGAYQTPYFQVMKYNSLPLKIYADVRSWTKILLRRKS